MDELRSRDIEIVKYQTVLAELIHSFFITENNARRRNNQVKQQFEGRDLAQIERALKQIDEPGGKFAGLVAYILLRDRVNKTAEAFVSLQKVACGYALEGDPRFESACAMGVDWRHRLIKWSVEQGATIEGRDTILPDRKDLLNDLSFWQWAPHGIELTPEECAKCPSAKIVLQVAQEKNRASLCDLIVSRPFDPLLGYAAEMIIRGEPDDELWNRLMFAAFAYTPSDVSSVPESGLEAHGRAPR